MRRPGSTANPGSGAPPPHGWLGVAPTATECESCSSRLLRRGFSGVASRLHPCGGSCWSATRPRASTATDASSRAHPPERDGRPAPASVGRLCGGVLLVGDVLTPGDGTALVVDLLHGDVRHEPAGRGAVPVVLTGLEVHAVTG